MKKLLKSKKGTLLGDFAGIVQNIFQTLPKPLLFIIFLVLILLIGGIIQYSLMIFGIFCDSNLRPVSIGFSASNYGLIADIPDENLIGVAGQGMSSWQAGIPIAPFISISLPVNKKSVTRCSMKEVMGKACTNSTNCYNFTDEWFFDGRMCANCTHGTVYVIDPSGTTHDIFNLCLGNAYRINDSEKSFWQKMFCRDDPNILQSCDVPVNHYYDSSLNVFVCSGDSCANQTIAQGWDEILRNNGAEYLYSNASSDYGDYKQAVGITCKQPDNFKPKIAVFGIPVFNYQYWLLIFVVVVLGYLYFKIKKG